MCLYLFIRTQMCVNSGHHRFGLRFTARSELFLDVANRARTCTTTRHFFSFSFSFSFLLSPRFWFVLQKAITVSAVAVLRFTPTASVDFHFIPSDSLHTPSSTNSAERRGERRKRVRLSPSAATAAPHYLIDQHF